MEHNINVCTATQVGCTTAEKGEFDGSLEQNGNYLARRRSAYLNDHVEDQRDDSER